MQTVLTVGIYNVNSYGQKRSLKRGKLTIDTYV